MNMLVHKYTERKFQQYENYQCNEITGPNFENASWKDVESHLQVEMRSFFHDRRKQGFIWKESFQVPNHNIT